VLEDRLNVRIEPQFAMTGNLPIITFDTSAHNRLVDDGARSQPVLARVKAGLFFRFAGLSIEELISTPDRIKRAALFESCAPSLAL
jgi:hypothetical protein